MRFWRGRRKRESDLHRELAFHVAERLAALERAGVSAEEARRRCREEFGGVEQVKEACRDVRPWQLIETFVADLRHGLRLLRKTPVWTAVVCLTLAGGIGLSTAIFSLVYGVLLRPLPYPNADSLVAICLSSRNDPGARLPVSAALWLDWRQNSRTVRPLALTRPVANFNLKSAGFPERLQGARTSFNLPEVLGVKPLVGRIFTEAEQQNDASVVMLSAALWQRRFGADRSIVGRKIQLNGEPFEVVGVMPPDYQYPTAAFELWTPLYIPPDEVIHGFNNQYLCVGRLKPGTDIGQSQAEFSQMMRRIADRFPAAYGWRSDRSNVVIQTLARSEGLEFRSTLLTLLGAVGCLLLIGCLNLSVLLIARLHARAPEVAMRVALGATAFRLRLARVAEVLPLCFAGIGGGIFVAWSLLRLLLPLLPAGIPRASSIGLQLPVLAFSVTTSLVVVLLADLLPRSPLRSGSALPLTSRTTTAPARQLLVIVQTALSLVLVVGGLLFGRSFAALEAVDPGFSRAGILTVHLAVTRARFPQDYDVAAYYQRLLERVRSVPGITAAGIVNRLPFSGQPQSGGIEFEGRQQRVDSDWRSATNGYFEALGIPLKQGRRFERWDTAQSMRVGLIDGRLAHSVFGNSSALGKRFRRYLPGLPAAKQDEWTTIVGVTGHILNDNLESDLRPQVYWPETQRTQDRGAMAIRTAGHPEAFAPAVIAAIHRENPEQPVYDLRTVQQWVGRSLARRTLLTGLTAIFGFASLTLASIGLYGLVAHAAYLRRREFGIRMALGAAAPEVFALVLRHAGTLALAGCAVGLTLAWPATRLLRGLLFGVTSGDWVSWSVAPALLMAVALFAGLMPAFHAARTDPAKTLRAN